MDDRKYRIVREVLALSVDVPGVVIDIAHNPDDSFSAVLYSDNLQTFEAGVRRNILMSVLEAANDCAAVGIPVYVERRAMA